jgi:CRP-like cAMP-binding protein
MMLENTTFFEHLTPKQRVEIEKISLIRHYGSEEIVFYEGEESSYFHFLILGGVLVFKSSSSAEPIVIHRFRAPSLIAEVATLKQIPYPASCKTTSDATILKIKREPFLELIQSDPSFSIALISSLSQKIGVLESALTRHNAPGAMAKVSRLLRDEPALFQKLKGIEIAQLIGITPETLSRMIKKLKSEGIITLSKRDGATLLLPEKLNGYCG